MLFSKNNKSTSGFKYIKIKYLIVKDIVNNGYIVVEHIDIVSMIVDPLTTGLRPIVFSKHVQSMGIIGSFNELVQ